MLNERNVACIHKNLWSFDSLLKNVDAPGLHQQRNILNIGETEDWQNKLHDVAYVHTAQQATLYQPLYKRWNAGKSS